eukprot:1936808-Rhodomonas_salina.1
MRLGGGERIRLGEGVRGRTEEMVPDGVIEGESQKLVITMECCLRTDNNGLHRGAGRGEGGQVSLGEDPPASGAAHSMGPGLECKTRLVHHRVEDKPVLTFLRLNTTTTDYAYYCISAAMTDQYFIDS